MAKTHGLSNTRIYHIWTSIKSRTNPNVKHSTDAHYTNTGVTMCDEWKNDFMAFYNWSMANGYTDDLTIDRRDNSKGYDPSNCRWATYKEQANNKTNNILVSDNGENMTLKQYCEKNDLDYKKELKRSQRRRQGVIPRENYESTREQIVSGRIETLKQLMQEYPTMPNTKIAEKMGVSESYIRKLKKALTV